MAMDAITKTAKQKYTNWEWLVVMEHDMVVPTDAFNRLAHYGDEHDIVGAAYVMHEPPHKLMAFVRRGEKFEVFSPERAKEVVDKPGLYECDGVPMGFTAIRRRVFDNWNPDVPMWQPTAEMPGHDIHFCNEARKQGFRIWLDTTIQPGHLTEMSIDYSHNTEGIGVSRL